MRTLITDAVLKQLLRDSVLRQQFGPQLKDMRRNAIRPAPHLLPAAVNCCRQTTLATSIEYRFHRIGENAALTVITGNQNSLEESERKISLFSYAPAGSPRHIW